MSNRIIDNHDWSEAVANTLRQMESPVDSEVWSRIERSMAPRRYYLGGWAAAAAAVLIALGYFMLESQPQIDLDGELFTYELLAQEAVEPSEVFEVFEAVEPSEVDLGTGVTVEPSREPRPVELVARSQEVSPRSQESAKEVAPAVSPSSDEVSAEPVSAEPTPVTTRPRAQESRLAYVPPSKASRPMTLAMGVSGGAMTAQGASGSGAAQVVLLNSGVVELSNDDSYSFADVSHHTPLSLGVSVGYPLAERLTLSGGVQYTQLNSDVEMGYSEHSILQRLQFVGLPLHLEYNIVETPTMWIYAGAGATAEYCLSAKVGDTRWDERRWHYSLGGVVGIEYKLANGLGLYCEPEASYYLTQTKLKSIRNQMPLSLSVRIGVRIMLR